jgi:protein-tyrosine phosphatase
MTIADGKAVAIHCRAGIGRSALIAASVLVSIGTDPDFTFNSI